MSLMSAMYNGISGLSSQSQAMAVVGNNLANSSTVGFKRTTTQFEDFFYQNVTTGSTFGQVGLGTDISSLYGDFTQGSFQTTGNPTDLAISGNGFFMVNNPNTNSTYYTRAGNFNFDKSGNLVDPNGYVVQGWQAYTDTTTGQVSNIGGLGDVHLSSFQISPSATTKLRMVTNLNKAATQSTNDSANPFFSLFETWAGQSDTPLSDTSYGYQSTLKVYDKAGAAHNVTIYYDKASNAAGANVWQYVVACDPSEDGRTINGVKTSSTSAAGLLMMGTLTFDSTGSIQNMSAFTLSSNASGNLKSLNNWTPANFSTDGYPVFTANFVEASNASTTTASNASSIKLDLGLHSTSRSGGWVGSATNASQVGSNAGNLVSVKSPKVDATTTTAYSGAFSIVEESQDGYAAGYLQDVKVTSDGVVEGVYSNNQTKNLFVLGLADFTNLQGLEREGKNLFSKTPASGDPRISTANTGGMGSIASGELEQSNVDTATEMVNMITYQNAFQANSKVITTINDMLTEVIQLKR